MSKAMLVAVMASLITVGMQPLLISVFGRRLLDVPNFRSSHALPTPRAGGIGVVAGMLPALAFPGTIWPLATTLLMALVGFRDDVKPLAAVPRLITQIAVCAATVALLTHWPLWVVSALTLFTVGYLNAFNFMDGVNAISALNAVVVGVGYVTAGLVYDSPVALGMGAVLAGTAVGFLPFNVTGRIFLGDVGSYAYGMAIAITAVTASVSGVPWPVLLGPLLIYYTDTGYTLIRRMRAGENPLQAHRDHVYQRLTTLGYSHVESACCNALFGVVTMGAGWLLADGQSLGWVLAPVAALAYLRLPELLPRRDHKVKAR